VTWPRERHFHVLAAEGPASAIPALEKLAADSKKPKDIDDCRKVAEAIVENARPRIVQWPTELLLGRMLRVLERIGNEKFGHAVLARRITR